MEEQIENEGSTDLAYSEMTAFSKIHQKAGENFALAINLIDLEDEDDQRQFHLQVENGHKLQVITGHVACMT